MKVCILTTSYPRFPGDSAGIFIERLTAALSKKGVGGIVIVPRDTSEPLIETKDGFEIHRVSYGIVRKGSLAFGRGILPNIRRNPLNALQIPGLLAGMTAAAWRCRNDYHLLHGQWIPSGIVAAATGCLTGRPSIATMRGEDSKLLSTPMLSPLVRAALSPVRAVTTVSDQFLSDIRSKGFFSRAHVESIHNGIERVTFSSPLPWPIAGQGLKLITVSRLIPLKRVEYAMQILAALQDKAATLLVVGGGDDQYRRSLEGIAGALGVSLRVQFTGDVPPERTLQLLSSADVFISGSSHEGRSNSLLEALAAGKICAVSDIPAHRELIADGKNGVLFSPEDPSAAAKRLAGLFSEEEERSQMAAAAVSSVSHLTWDACAERYISLYETLLRSRSQ